MGIDLAKMKAKRDALENRGNGKSAFWRPEDGETVIRILPTSDGDPFKEFWFHYNLGNNRGFLSPKRNFGEEDPLNDFVRKLFNEGTEDSVKMEKNLMARQRFFSPVIVRGEEEKGDKRKRRKKKKKTKPPVFQLMNTFHNVPEQRRSERSSPP